MPAAAARYRRRLVAELQARACIVSPAVRDAFLDVPREAFLPAFAETEGLEAVYRDVAVPTKHGADGLPTSSSSQPAIMALMLERLDVRPGHRVLEIGAGTGYNAALLRELVGRRGEVVSVELDGDVARGARRRLRAAGRNARVVVGDGHDGWPARAPYDRIVVTASSATVPHPWRDQLVDGGLVEVPLRLREAGPHAIATLRRDGERLSSVSVLSGGFMPLRGSATIEPRIALSASQLEGSRQRRLAELSGPGLRALGPTARRRLLGMVLGDPHSERRVRVAADGWPLALYLGLELPRRRVVESWSLPGIGLVASAGRSLALLAIVPPTGPSRAAAGRLLGFGEDAALTELERAVAGWQARGRPTEDDLRLTVTFDGGRARIRTRWRPLQRG
jgi:protein-L-isoaspartate(D-aspartate) O-methyltransferase